jgi:hypothetical protein
MQAKLAEMKQKAEKLKNPSMIKAIWGEIYKLDTEIEEKILGSATTSSHFPPLDSLQADNDKMHDVETNADNGITAGDLITSKKQTQLIHVRSLQIV